MRTASLLVVLAITVEKPHVADVTGGRTNVHSGRRQIARFRQRDNYRQPAGRPLPSLPYVTTSVIRVISYIYIHELLLSRYHPPERER